MAGGPLPDRKKPTHGVESLTKREVKILEGIREGMSEYEIAERDHVKQSTVHSQAQRIRDKLGVSSLKEAAELAKR